MTQLLLCDLNLEVVLTQLEESSELVKLNENETI